VIAELLYYWTSGDPCHQSESGNDFNINKICWCSTNLTTPLNYSLQTDQKPKCLAYERWTGKYKPIACNKKLSFVCEVSAFLNKVFE